MKGWAIVQKDSLLCENLLHPQCLHWLMPGALGICSAQVSVVTAVK